MFLLLLRAFTTRLKTYFAGPDLTDEEAEILDFQTERKAELLRKADQSEENGMSFVAAEFRRQAQEFNQ
jgi:hypothetical protein